MARELLASALTPRNTGVFRGVLYAGRFRLSGLKRGGGGLVCRRLTMGFFAEFADVGAECVEVIVADMSVPDGHR